MPSEAVGAIQGILAPAIMVSACGLLLLGLLNRYGGVMSRIRALNDERRKLVKALTPPATGSKEEAARLASVLRQLEDLLRRVALLRNGILALVIAVGCFVGTSLLLGLQVAGVSLLGLVRPLGLFLLGMAAVFVGLVFEGLDVAKAWRTIRYEVADLFQSTSREKHRD